ncbi:Aldolase-type TIM barrel [Penicillium malachiteum]|uniref:Aldolase-type TIM barrel n=1 Tax=Penicillium malachiteum TaxID=1324776 RepID=UPI0025476ECF|nr:Aldolase-type TIM barrel [Penicillium malachiteum]KAJ5725993.1 Aldolase-type TIM barrel [Penicillium malachiteum]
MGRAAYSDVAREEGVDIIGPSAIPIEEGAPVPREMTFDEIQQVISDFVYASMKAMEAGFNGVEVHGANGYLLDQFLQDTSNQRQGEFGSSVKNRSRLLDCVIKAVANAIGPDRFGLRLSLWSVFQGMRMSGLIPQFTNIILKARKFNIAYLHLIEGRVTGARDNDSHDTLDFAYDLWTGPVLVAGGYTLSEARRLLDEIHPDKKILVVFGRYFISNRDLAFRMREGLELTAYRRDTFYAVGSPVGYSDYAFSK